MFINWTETLGVMMAQANTYTTGSMVASLLIILIMILAVCFMFGIPIEYTIVIVFPYLLATSAYYHDLVGPLIVGILYSAMLITKLWIFK